MNLMLEGLHAKHTLRRGIRITTKHLLHVRGKTRKTWLKLGIRKKFLTGVGTPIQHSGLMLSGWVMNICTAAYAAHKSILWAECRVTKCHLVFLNLNG
jgi:hypothetical protein